MLLSSVVAADAAVVHRPSTVQTSFRGVVVSRGRDRLESDVVLVLVLIVSQESLVMSS